jgi:hypothetical protein
MPAKITFAHLPFEIHHEIWRLAAESEAGIVHKFSVHCLADQSSHDPLPNGVLQFPRGPSYFLSLWDPLDNGQPAWLPLGNVCPEAGRVVKEVHPSAGRCWYRTEDGKEQTRTLWIRPKQDLFFLNLHASLSVGWPKLLRQFRGGVEHVAFRVDPAWYRYEFVCPDTSLRSHIKDSLAEEKEGSEDGEIVDVPPSLEWSKGEGMLRALAWSIAPSVRWIKNVWLVDTEVRRRKTWKKHHKGQQRDKGLGSRQVFYGKGVRFVEVWQDDPGWDFNAGHKESQQKGYRGTRPTGDGVGEKLKDRNAFHLVRGMEDWPWRDRMRFLTLHQSWRNIASPKVGVLAMEKWP